MTGVGGSFLSAAVVGVARSPTSGSRFCSGLGSGSGSGSGSGLFSGSGSASGSANAAAAAVSREPRYRGVRLASAANAPHPYTHYQKRLEQLRRETVWLEQTLLSLHRDYEL